MNYDPTPHHWFRTAVQSSGNLFDVVHFGSRIQFTPGDLRILDCKVETRGLTLEKALETGQLLEDADLKLLPFRDKKKKLPNECTNQLDRGSIQKGNRKASRLGSYQTKTRGQG